MGDLPDWQTRISTGDDDVLLTTSLVQNASTAVLDVAAYASLQGFLTSTTRTAMMNLVLAWIDTNGDTITSDTLTAYPAPLAVDWPSLQVPVRAPKLQVTNFGADTLGLTLLGSQRHADKLVGVGYTDHMSFVNNTAAMVAGVFYDVGATPYLTSQGLHQLEMSLSNASVTGTLVASFDNAAFSSVNQSLADTVEGVTDAGVRVVTKQVILPASLCKLRFLCRTAGSSTVGANFISVGQ